MRAQLITESESMDARNSSCVTLSLPSLTHNTKDDSIDPCTPLKVLEKLEEHKDNITHKRANEITSLRVYSIV